ncbi:ATP-binding protein [Kordiimonas sp.]|uniref:tetratricopeptide repeat-containing sensor histidine kinase n=1 Tax=Kordiimonas sp. TaxID=1970157 RepID=UPI003A8F2B4C
MLTAAASRLMRYAFTLGFLLVFTFSTFAATKLSDDARMRAEALLPRLLEATALDAHLRLEALNANLETTTNERARGQVLKDLIFYHIDTGVAEGLDEIASEAISLGEKLDDVSLQVYGRLGLAEIEYIAGSIKNAESQIKEALTLAEARGSVADQFFARSSLAALGPELGNLLEGLLAMTQSVSMLEGTPEGEKMRMTAYLTLAYIYTGVSEIDEIVENYAKALDIATRAHIALDRETIMFNIASSLNDIDENALARRYYEALTEVLTQTGHKEGQYYALYGLAWIAYDEERYGDCITLAHEALNDFEGEPGFDVELYDLLAIGYARQGNAVEARRYRQIVLEEYEKYPDLKLVISDADDQLTEAYILAAEGQYEEGFELLNKARRGLMDDQFESFQTSVTDLRSSIVTMIEKQRTEEALHAAEAANRRLLVILTFFIIAGAVALVFIMRKHNRALARSKHAADMANRSKSEFLANMSHELRTPLNAILGFSEMMEQRVFGELGAKQYGDYVGHINESGRLLLDIINDILDLSKIESGKLIVRDEIIDLRQLLGDLAKLMAPRVRPKNITLTVDVPPRTPYLRADTRLCKQILLNVLSNASKFTENDGEIDCRVYALDNGDIIVEVEDTGIGMSEDELEIALLPFGQAGTTATRSHEGTGLGLPLVKSLIELHGGKLEVRSIKRMGTLVILTFPANRSVQPSEVPVPPTTVDEDPSEPPR